jgi:Family of unknown function (DUF5719)
VTTDGFPGPPRPRRPVRSDRRVVRRVPIVILVLGCLVAAAVLESSRRDRAPAQRPSIAAATEVPTTDAVSATWYCAEGTAQGDGRANETLVIANIGASEAQATMTVMPGGDEETRSRTVTVGEGEQVRVPVTDIVEAPEIADPAGVLFGPGVMVEVFGGRSIVEHVIEGEEDYAIGPCARDARREWYFGAGSTERGAQQHLALFNPFAGDAIVDVTFLSEEGFESPADLQALVVPRRTRVVVPVHNFSRRHARVATHIAVQSGNVVAEQSNAFTTEHAIRRGLTLSPGAPSPEMEWTFSNVVGGGAEQTLTVANFAPSETDVEIVVRGSEDIIDPETVTVAGQSAAVVDLSGRLESPEPVSVQVRSLRATPVIAEQLAWFDSSIIQGVATVLGSPAASSRWAFVLGRLEPESNCEVTVFNSGRTPTRVRLVSYVGGRRTVVAQERVGGVQPVTFNLATLEVDPDQVVVVDADAPVVATRLTSGPEGRSLAAGALDDTG